MEKAKKAAIALSLANLFFIREWAVLLKTSNWFSMNLILIPYHLIALILNVIVLAGGFYLGWRIARSSQNKVATILARGSFLGALTILLTVIFELNGIEYSEFLYGSNGYWRFLMHYEWRFLAARFIFYSFAAFGLIQKKNKNIRHASILCLMALTLPPFIPEMILFGLLIFLALQFWHRPVIRFALKTLLILSPFILVTLSQAAWRIVEVRSIVRNKPVVQKTRSNIISETRVLWLIFDEMDQRFSFPGRPATLKLPELDRLRAKSFYAANAYSPASSTYLSISALLTGQLVSLCKPTPSDMMITLAKSGETVKLSAQPSIFTKAFKAGFNTAFVSETENWQSIFKSQTNTQLEKNFTLDDPLAAMFKIIAYQSSRLLPIWSATRKATLQRQLSNQSVVNDYQAALYNAKKCVQDPGLGLIVAYFLLPHYPYIYDRSARELIYDYKNTPEGDNEGYLNNLALVDRTLGELRIVMEQSGTWEKTAVILSSDHHWRDAKFYDGKVFDRWVPFIVKLPGQNEGILYERRLETLLTHDLVLALLDREISGPRELVRWIDHRRKSP